MPKKKKKAPATVGVGNYLRVATGLYGEMLGATKRSEIIEEQEKWDDNELFILSHLTYLKLQQGQKIIALLEEIAENTADIAEAAESDADSGEEDDIEEDDFDDSDDSDEGGEGGEVIPLSSAGTPKAEMLDHPQPPTGSDP
ncbi:MAG: hypothetical protein ACI8RZ_001482 [Myxococcota bacterium]|jgi:hypothetical protein